MVNSTFELKDLISRLARLICQIFNAKYCVILLLDHSTKYSIFKCTINNKTKYVIDKKTKITNRLEKKIIRTLTSIRKDKLIGLPLVCDDTMGVVILKRQKDTPDFDSFDQSMLVTITEQAIIGIRNLQLYEDQQKTVLGSIKSLVSLLDMRVPQEYTHSPYFSRLVMAIAEQLHLDEKGRRRA